MPRIGACGVPWATAETGLMMPSETCEPAKGHVLGYGGSWYCSASSQAHSWRCTTWVSSISSPGSSCPYPGAKIVLLWLWDGAGTGRTAPQWALHLLTEWANCCSLGIPQAKGGLKVLLGGFEPQLLNKTWITYVLCLSFSLLCVERSAFCLLCVRYKQTCSAEIAARRSWCLFPFSPCYQRNLW